MDNTQILAALAQVLGMAQETVAVVTESPEIAAAKAARKAKITEAGNEIARDLLAVFEKHDLDAKVAIQVCNAAVTPFISIRDQYFWSIDKADKAAQRLARMEATGQWEDDARGGMKDSSDDGSSGNGEINPMRQCEDAIKYHNRNAEQYELLTHAMNAAWCRLEADVVEQGSDVGFIPDFGITDKEYQTYLARQQQRNQRSTKNQQAVANVQASRIERETTTSFLGG